MLYSSVASVQPSLMGDHLMHDRTPYCWVTSLQEKRSAYAPTEEEPVRYDGIYRIARCWRKAGMQKFLVCRYLFVRCDNEPAPWSTEGQPSHFDCSQHHLFILTDYMVGMHHMLTVALTEGGQATGITFVWVLVELSSGPCWDIWVGQAVLLLTGASSAIIALCCHPLLLQSEPSASA